MPPKEKVSKAKIQETAFEMTREYGFGQVTARRLADRLGCSTQPIFRSYENMDELREDLFYMSSGYFCEYLLSKKPRSKPMYLTLALGYIEMASKEKNLFELIASVDDFGCETIDEFLKSEDWEQCVDKLPGMENKTFAEKLEVFTMLFMFVHGMATLIASNRVELSEKKIKSLITKAYEGFRATR